MSERMGVTECLNNLALSDKRHGELKGRVKAWDHRLKTQKALLKLQANAPSNNAKEDEALASNTYQSLVNEYENDCAEFYVLEAERATWALTVEVWRTQQANKRHGNIN